MGPDLDRATDGTDPTAGTDVGDRADVFNTGGERTLSTMWLLAKDPVLALGPAASSIGRAAGRRRGSADARRHFRHMCETCVFDPKGVLRTPRFVGDA